MLRNNLPGLPEFVPVLKACNMHKGSMTGPNGTHCLYGHVLKHVPYVPSQEAVVVLLQRRAATLLQRKRARGEGYRWLGLTTLNDLHLTRTEAAQVWNETMEKDLGYDGKIVDA